MLAALADSMAAFRRTFPLGSPPPLRAATVISRRILEKSLPRWTSVLPFFRLICDHRECPDMPLPAFLDGRLQLLDPPQPARPTLGRRLPAPALGRVRGREGRAGRRLQPRAEVDEAQVGR